MKSKIMSFGLIITFLFLVSACSSTQNVSENSSVKTPEKIKKDSLYVFDAVPSNDESKEINGKTDTASNVINPVRMQMTYYIVQIGAFTTKERAEQYANESRNKINYKIKVSFNQDIHLYVVQLENEYTSHDEAERIRNGLWKMNEFNDAWITSVRK